LLKFGFISLVIDHRKIGENVTKSEAGRSLVFAGLLPLVCPIWIFFNVVCVYSFKTLIWQWLKAMILIKEHVE